MPNPLKHPIEYLQNVGPERAKVLKSELGIYTYSDLINYFPFRYIDRSRIYRISELNTAEVEVQIIGKITNLVEKQSGKKKRLTATFSDESGTIYLNWFRYNKWLQEKIPINKEVVLYGKVAVFNGNINISHPEINEIEDYKKRNGIAWQPVYSLTEMLIKRQINQLTIRKLLANLFDETKASITESLSPELIAKRKLISRVDAYQNIHFPQNQKNIGEAQLRIKYEELFYLQLKLLLKRGLRKRTIKGNPFVKVGKYFHDLYENHLSFELTNAQKCVLKEIRHDLGQNKQMNRLLQGDVGSGKTIVALLSMLMAIDNGFQCLLMAPTEILAQQHYKEISSLLEKIGLKAEILTGSVKGKKRKELLSELEAGNLHILIGTHALIEDKVKFPNLGLAIIDEQHKFGVAQRAKLYAKAKISPHVLVMTATPIPRTLAMSVYGDLDISTIDELPVGRKKIDTHHRFDSRRLEVFAFIKKQIELGRQVYVVYPLINESEKLDYKDLMDGYESISREFPLPKYALSMVHGQLKPEEKEYEMQRFVRGETQIMVSTTVIEVGVNVPNASVMIIESAERFGLSQLHQLRGRVGRGSEKSYCILMTGYKLSAEAKKRIETMVKTQNGFEIAEVDMQLRGPGDIMGTQQSGMLNLKLASLSKDQQLLFLARQDAEEMLENDPNLSLDKNKSIREFFLQNHADALEWNKVG